MTILSRAIKAASWVGLSSLLLTGCSSLALSESAAAIPVKVVVVTMFEIGEDAGDMAGEYQLWKERENLTQCFEMKNAYHEVCMNDKGVMAMVTGIGTAHSTASTMAVAMDERFDLTQAYWLVAGIAGVNPHKASVGSAAWAEWLVDGDLSHEIDAREIPADWDTGYVARGTHKPWDKENRPDALGDGRGEVFRLDSDLTNWAYGLTKAMDLGDFDGLQKLRDEWVGYPEAQRTPFVLKGDQLAAMTFWHGKLMSEWATKWVDFWSDGQGEYVTSAMEETGTYLSLKFADRAGKVDVSRMLVLRTASNYDQQPPGMTAAKSLARESEGLTGLRASLETAHMVGSKVVDEIVDNWAVYQTRKPTPQDL